ncbi:7,8-dihydro-8-oxoguanine triphosphatase [Caldalkalibacillus thermarum]|uniref:NUDIX hydrolase n=1 Tax=Caldalkalibacillus thermarum TaxID=296745 RepID=UPI00166C3DF7|nr:8-oxo-dGTP diphosphatase [Caldalkalibacillus thermarum]GGK23771.1 7,8-dihydro-8-oxoguanine triphosphatase [Caldalkalibacillus thermarum]
MFEYTLCFIRRDNHILMLNREKAPWQGMWNGIGGKIDPGESPDTSMKREIAEEAGLNIEPVLRGCVRWNVDHARYGGMYVYTAELDIDIPYITPKKNDEGILDWKHIDWVMDPENLGIVSNIPKFLPALFEEQHMYEHHCVYRGNQLVDYVRKQWAPNLIKG